MQTCGQAGCRQVRVMQVSAPCSAACLARMVTFRATSMPARSSRGSGSVYLGETHDWHLVLSVLGCKRFWHCTVLPARSTRGSGSVYLRCANTGLPVGCICWSVAACQQQWAPARRVPAPSWHPAYDGSAAQCRRCARHSAQARPAKIARTLRPWPLTRCPKRTGRRPRSC
jgi:hypothetical protein